jgi:hypothetical protein
VKFPDINNVRVRLRRGQWLLSLVSTYQINCMSVTLCGAYTVSAQRLQLILYPRQVLKEILGFENYKMVTSFVLEVLSNPIIRSKGIFAAQLTTIYDASLILGVTEGSDIDGGFPYMGNVLELMLELDGVKVGRLLGDDVHL